jgi:hypothetical protein
VGFEATTLEAAQKMKGLAESYFLIKDQDDEVERFKGEDSGNKDVGFLEHSTKLKHLYLHVFRDYVRSFFLHLFLIVLSQ